MRQCLQHLWTCTARGKLDREDFETHWQRLANRAMRDFQGDLELLDRES